MHINVCAMVIRGTKCCSPSLTDWSFLFVLFAQVEPIRNLFAALFLASIGMLIHVHFLWNHVDILLASVILVFIVKSILITVVVKGFGYNNRTSVLVKHCTATLYLCFFSSFLGVVSLLRHLGSSSAGWNVFSTNWGIRFCSSQSCF